MRQLQVKLTRRETTLAVVVGVLLLFILVFQFLARQEASAQTETRTKIGQVRRELVRAEDQANLTDLEREKEELTKALASGPALTAAGNDVVLELWRWAGTTRIQMKGLTYNATTAQLAGAPLRVHRFVMVLQGPARSLQLFVRGITGAYQQAQVENLSIRSTPRPETWEMSMTLTLYTPEGSGG